MSKHVHNDPTNRPTFIAGCGRSGTTFVRVLLDAHPDVFFPPETLCLADYLINEQYVPPPVLQKLFFKEPQIRSWYTGPAFPFTSVPEAIRRIHEYAAEEEKKILWGQKTPRFIRFMKTFENAFPDIRWILIYRDPRAVAASMIRSARHTNSLSKACGRWLKDNRPIIQNLSSGNRSSGKFLILCYENLIRDLEHKLPVLYNFLGVRPLSMDEVRKRAVLRRHRGIGFRKSTVRNGIRPDLKRLYAWEQQLTSPELAYIENRCRKEMTQLGYTPHTKRTTSMATPSCMNGLLDYVRIPIQYMIHWPIYPVYTCIRKLIFHLFQKIAHVQQTFSLTH